MNETDIDERLLQDLRGHLPGAFVCKHHDVGTKGVPDIQIAYSNRTSWVETKLLRPKDSLKKICKVQQLILCHELAQANLGRCWIVVFEVFPRRVTIWQPRVIFTYLWPRISGVIMDGFQAVGGSPLRILATDAEISHKIGAFGAVQIKGWHYDIARRLVIDALRKESS